MQIERGLTSPIDIIERTSSPVYQKIDNTYISIQMGHSRLRSTLQGVGPLYNSQTTGRLQCLSSRCQYIPVKHIINLHYPYQLGCYLSKHPCFVRQCHIFCQKSQGAKEAIGMSEIIHLMSFQGSVKHIPFLLQIYVKCPTDAFQKDNFLRNSSRPAKNNF